METPPWEASKRVARHDYDGVVWQSTQNPRSFLDSVMDSVGEPPSQIIVWWDLALVVNHETSLSLSASSSKGGSAVRRTASEPAQSQRRGETLNARTRSTIGAAPRSAPAGAGTAPYSVPHSSLRRRGRRSGLGTEDPTGESATATPASDVDLDQVAGLVGTVARSLHARPTKSLANFPVPQLAASGSRSFGSASQPRSGMPRPASRNGIESRLTHPTRNTQVLIPRSRSFKSIEPPVVASSNAIQIDTPTPRSHIENNTTLHNTISSLSPSQGLGHGGSQRGPRMGQNSLIEANSIPRPSPSHQQLSPIIKRFGTSRAGNMAVSKMKSLGMKGTLTSTAASKPFKPPLPAVAKRSTPIHSSIRREVPGSPGNMSSDSLDTSFGIDMDCLEEHLKTYDDG